MTRRITAGPSIHNCLEKQAGIMIRSADFADPVCSRIHFSFHFKSMRSPAESCSTFCQTSHSLNVEAVFLRSKKSAGMFIVWLYRYSS